MNLSGLKGASGLTEADAALLEELVDVLNRNLEKHEERRAYYEDKHVVANRGMKLHREYEGLNVANGWARKTVNALAERSVFDSFVMDGENDEFSRAVADNDIVGSYEMACVSSLTDGCGFWTVSKGETDKGEPPAIVNYHDATTASGVWDYRRKRIKAGLVIEDFARFGKSKAYIPSVVVMHTAGNVVIITRSDRSTWSAEYRPHKAGVPMIVPMVYKRSDRRPFGQSRISKAVMGFVDSMQSEWRNAIIQADFESIPTKFVTGISDKQYDAMSESLHDAYKAEMLLLTANEDGTLPQPGMLQGAAMTPHIAMMDKIANMMAAESSLPVATFGVAGNGYTSSDALRASTDDLVVLAKSMNKANAKCMSMVAKLMLAVIGDKPLSMLDDAERSVSAHFEDPAMPSDAANADAQIKIASAMPEYAGSDVFLERLGYSEDERKRIKADSAGNRATQALVDKLFGE